MSSERQSPSILLESPSERVFDPLLRYLELRHVETYYPYGFPLKISSNSAAVLDAARQSFGYFEAASIAPPIELEVIVDGPDSCPMPSQPVIRTRGHMLTLAADSLHFGSCDFERGYGNLWISPRLLRDTAALRYFFLETLSLCMICDRHLAPIHASCVALEGSGVLLCGVSTAGKSTLAYACARRGFTYICDDGSFLVRAASDRIVTGNCQSIRFRPSAAELFPELSDIPAIRRANGKLAIEVPVRMLGLRHAADRCRVDHIVFLNRQRSGRSRFRPFSRDTALAELEKAYSYGRDRGIEEQRQALGRLMDLEILELTYSDLDDAVDALENLLLTNEVAK